MFKGIIKTNSRMHNHFPRLVNTFQLYNTNITVIWLNYYDFN